MEENEIVSSEDLKETDVNGVKIANEVVAIIAGVATSEVQGVAGMSGGLVGGISEILGKKNFSKGIKVEVEGNEAAIEIYIIVEYGVRIPDVAFEIQSRVKKTVETMTGLKVSNVNVHVQGVKTSEEKENNQEEQNQ